METILINKVENATSKAGKPYMKVLTDKGNMSAFDSKITDEISKSVGKYVQVEIASTPDGKFKNIRAFGNVVENPSGPINAEVQKMSADQFKEAREEKNKSIYASYAKDILIATGKPAKECCEIVKAILKEFE